MRIHHKDHRREQICGQLFCNPDMKNLSADASPEKIVFRSLAAMSVSKGIEDGTELLLDIRKAVDFVGENMFFEEGRYPVSAVCLEDTLTCGFSRSQFEEFVL